MLNILSYVSGSSVCPPCRSICSPRARDIKERINKLDFIKIKIFCTTKGNISKVKREQTIWENIFANETLGNGFISKIYKELTWLHTRKTNNLIKKWTNNLKFWTLCPHSQITNTIKLWFSIYLILVLFSFFLQQKSSLSYSSLNLI